MSDVDLIDTDTGEIRVYPKQVFVRSYYNYDMDAVSDETGLKCEDPSRAQQQFKEECDINTIVERFGITGELPTNVRIPESAVFEDVYDYHSALNAIIAADNAFMEFPADIREQFGNDAGKFVAFAENPANIEKMREWKLAPPAKKAAEPLLVRMAPEPAPDQ